MCDGTTMCAFGPWPATSLNEIETTDIESKMPMVPHSQHLERMEQLSATNASWDRNLHRKSTTGTTLTSVTSNLHLTIFISTTDDYTCLLHEAMPTNYTLMREDYTVQMHIPSTTLTLVPTNWCSYTCVKWCVRPHPTATYLHSGVTQYWMSKYNEDLDVGWHATFRLDTILRQGHFKELVL